MKAPPILLIDQAASIERALSTLSDGGLVALPTETVYGLAADATNGAAVARIFAAKGRPQFNPLICHVSDLAMAERYGEIDETARRLANVFWPGPLTIVVPLKNDCGVHELVTAGLGTIGLRCPEGAARSLIARFGKPLAAPSANSSGKISPTNAQHVADDLGDKVDMILDGGACPVGLESTIVKVNAGGVTLLRSGAVTLEMLEACLSRPVFFSAGGKIEAPGMMRSHYAPEASVRLNAQAVRKGEALLSFGPLALPGSEEATAVLNLSPSGDMQEAASNLFAYLKRLDASGAKVIAVASVPEIGLGVAINDRLSRAAAPRT